ncbi:Tat proofreading chaperone FdhE [Selenomonas ruminantium]|uniref:Tat proofreading chaperone FdhE n=1 Tax=Selenomonas ruminantium TaxID=971 RepID=A0A1M6VLW4_SELRU|nr:formate dehydrogenase accessory protein FdhE [Selenomonas ruminantium]SHK82354.1 Tat proofreading chaperone FdhE [Selenomonas ruminantium]
MNAMEKNIHAHLEKHPFLAETALLHMTMAARVRALVKPLDWELTATEAKTLQEPLLQQAKWQQPIVEAAAAALPAVLPTLENIGYPARLVEAIAAFNTWVKQADKDTRKTFFVHLLQGGGALPELNPALLGILGWQILEALIPAPLKDHAFWQQAGWTKNACPVCGRQPVLAHLRKEKEGRARFLTCDGCHTEWPFARIGCAYCGNEDLTQMHILEPEGLPAMRIDVCDACRNYLKTYNEEGQEDVYLTDWATLHLDMLGEEAGFTKKGSILLENS